MEQVGDREYNVKMKTGLHGIIDGGHTYKLIVMNRDNEDLLTFDLALGDCLGLRTVHAGELRGSGVNIAVRNHAWDNRPLEANHFVWFLAKLL